MANQRQTGVSTFTGPEPNRFMQIGHGPVSVPRSVRSLQFGMINYNADFN